MSPQSKTALRKRLMQIAGKPLRGNGAIIIHEEGMYLAGYPYLWSADGSRAYVFRDAAQAQDIIDRYGLPATVHTRA